MAMITPYPARVEFHADRHIDRWRPLVQWLLAVPHLLIARALSTLRSVLTLISFFTVLFTEQIPRPLFDMIAMTYRYEWRAMSYALFLHEDYPPFDFQPAADDDGVEPHTSLSITYPERLGRWKPLYKWFLAIPHYVVLVALDDRGLLRGYRRVLRRCVHGRVPARLPRLPRHGVPVRPSCERLRRIAHRPIPPVLARDMILVSVEVRMLRTVEASPVREVVR